MHSNTLRITKNDARNDARNYGMGGMDIGQRVERVRPWRYHGEPDECAGRHTGTVIAGRYDSLGYITVALDEGPVVVWHPWDAREIATV